MLSALGEQRVLVVGLFFYVLQQVFLAAATQKWVALAAVSLGSVGKWGRGGLACLPYDLPQ
jgi:hypothetical protein